MSPIGTVTGAARKLAKIRSFYALQTALFSGKPYVNEYAVFSDLVGEENDS